MAVDVYSKVSGEAEAAVSSLLMETGALLYGKFILASGKESDYYFDSKKLTLHPKGAHFVAQHIVKKLDEFGIDHVGGTAYSAIPIVSHVALFSELYGQKPISAFYHRKESKGHGPNELAEGQLPPDNINVAIVEDVVTSGNSMLDAIQMAKDSGCQVTHALTLVDRNEGGREKVEKEGYKFWSLFTVERSGNEIEFVCNAS
jgi:orotate phosphoribosyltransferase